MDIKFLEVIVENTDNVEKIDLTKVDWQSSREFFASLKDELEKLDERDERYDFTWVGKRKSIIEAGAPIDEILRPDVNASKDFDNTENLLIVGDNLDALKLLQESYLGQVKMIYIDPPYNTGHDFVYHDDFRRKLADYQDDSIGEDGEQLVADEEPKENSRANGRFHSDWLSMIYPRLKVARNLLADDGVIFISIDDNEQANLKRLCDEVFGGENFITTIVNQSANSVFGTKAAHKDSTFVKVKDYVLVYRKSEKYTITPVYVPSRSFMYDSHEFVLENGKKYSTTEWFAEKYGDLFKTYQLPVNKQNIQRILEFNEAFRKDVMPQLVELQHGTWPYTKNDFTEEELGALRNGEIIEHNGLKIIQEDNGKGMIRFLRSLKDSCQFVDGEYRKCDILGDVWNTSAGYGNINAEGNMKFQNGKKPLMLLERILKTSTSATESNLILDFFAGSGTTAHAVMNLNAEDGGKRKFILVQLDEKTAEKSEAKKAGYDTIDQITAERIRRAGDKITKEYPDAKIDTGFRVLKVDSANEKDGLRKTPEEYNQAELSFAVENLKPERTPLDLLFGVIYTQKMSFQTKLEIRKIGDNTIYLYGYYGADTGTGIVACFDDQIPEDTIREITKLKPLVAAFKDASFANSAEKINLSEIFRVLSPETKIKVV